LHGTSREQRPARKWPRHQQAIIIMEEKKIYVTVISDEDCAVREVKGHETDEKAKAYARQAYETTCEEYGVEPENRSEMNHYGCYSIYGWQVSVHEVETPWLS